MIDSNIADVGGGGIATTAQALVVGGPTMITSNRAGRNGGGIHLALSAHVRIEGGTLIDGNFAGANNSNRTGGGGISNLGAMLEVADSVISNNIAANGVGEGNGGGIETEAGSVNLTNVTFDGNTAEASGGGVYVLGAGTVTITGGNISDNQAFAGGGGIWNSASAMITITNTTISNNTAQGDLNDQGGGGIFNDGGTLIVNGGSITNNQAGHGGGGIENNNGHVTLSNVSVNENSAGTNGGGLHITGTGTATITGGTVNSNTAADEGGGLWNSTTGTLTVTGTTIDGNTANGSGHEKGGGGVFNDGGEVNLANVTVTNNLSTGTIIGSGGGGILNDGKMTITTSLIQGNLAGEATFDGVGGGIFNTSSGVLAVIGGTIDNNTARDTGGGIENRGGSIVLADVTVSNNSAVISGGGLNQSFTATATILDGLVQGNTALSGGGLQNSPDGTMTIDGTIILQNVATGIQSRDGGGGLDNDRGVVFISNATITNNQSLANDFQGGGGGILNDGVMSISNTAITSNSAIVDFAFGGGILNLDDGNLTISGTGSQIAGNEAGGSGGGISNISGTVTLTDVSIIGNESGLFGGGIANGLSTAFDINPGTIAINGGAIDENTAEEGGGIWNSKNGIVQIQSSDLGGTNINGNTATGDGISGRPIQGGGAIFNDARTSSHQAGTISVTDAIITYNAATGPTNGSGGAILSIGGAVSITDTTIDKNEAVRAGGGIEIVEGTVTITDTEITRNDVSDADLFGRGLSGNPGNGGGVHVTSTATVTLSGGMVSNNVADQQGGGLWNSSTGIMTINGTTIDGNTANGNSADLGGGGIFNEGGTLTVGNTAPVSITNNVAVGELGSGGGIFNNTGGTVTITRSTLDSNTASAGGGIFNQDGMLTVQGGAMISANSVTNNGGGISNNRGVLMVDASTIATNIANAGGGIFNFGSGALVMIQSGAIISGNSVVADGGGINNNNGGTLTLDASTVGANTAGNSGGGIANYETATITGGSTISENSASADGGGIVNSTGTLSVQSSTIDSNTASDDGGGIFHTNNGTATIQGGSTITGNSANAGGGIFNASTLTVDGSTIGSNTGTGAGGGIFNSGAVTIQNGAAVIANRTAQFGGGIDNELGGTLTVDDSTISSNSASLSGGGIFNDGTATIQGGSMITGNFAAFEGGGLWNGTGTMTLENVTIDGNTASGTSADQTGGGIFNNGGIVDVTTSTISNNVAERNGGGILNILGGTVVLTDSTVTGNSADSTNGRGGGVLNFGDFEATNSTIDNNSAGFGAGISNGIAGVANGGHVVLTNSTVSSNTASSASGIFSHRGTVELRNSTVAFNQAKSLAGTAGIHSNGAVFTLISTLVANNASIGAGKQILSDVVGDVSDGGNSVNNLVGASMESGLTHGVNGNQVGTAANPIDPRLGPLADNGGPTRTHALLPDSPAINAGDNPLGLMFDQRGTPFVREFGSGIDPQQTDIGAFELQSATGGGNDIIVTATGPGIEGQVQVANAITQEVLFNITPFPGFTGGVRVAVGDVNGDLVPDIITAAGPGGGPHVKVIDGTDGTTELMSFFAYNAGFTGGVFVAAADLTRDNKADIITGADAGGGPHVRVVNGAGGSDLFSVFAYNSHFTGGVRVAAGDITGDGIPDIITGAGPGGGPHVRVFDGSVPQVTYSPVDIRTTMSIPLGSFFPYGLAFAGGVFVAAGDVNGDDRIDIVTGADAGGGPHVRIFDGNTGSQMAGDIGSFFAYDPAFTGGVRVAANDITGDGKADIITSPGQTGDPFVRVFDAENAGPEIIRSVFVRDLLFTGGLFVAGSVKLESGSPLRLASGFATNLDAESLTDAEAEPVFQAALARLEAAGLPSDVVDVLSTVTIQIADLGGNRLGESLPGAIRLDINAAGLGWFIDPTPATDEEFAGSKLNAIAPSAIDHVDLFTVLLHELAHQLGGVDLDAEIHPGHLLADSLAAGQRRLPDEDLDELFADGDLLNDLLGG